MKAPDKIYVGVQDLGNGYATDMCLTPRDGYDEYIRKDALHKCLLLNIRKSIVPAQDHTPVTHL